MPVAATAPLALQERWLAPLVPPVASQEAPMSCGVGFIPRAHVGVVADTAPPPSGRPLFGASSLVVSLFELLMLLLQLELPFSDPSSFLATPPSFPGSSQGPAEGQNFK